MKKTIATLTAIILFAFCASFLFAETPEDIEDKTMKERGDVMDRQIQKYMKDMQDMIAKQKLMTLEDIKILPYQTNFKHVVNGNDKELKSSGEEEFDKEEGNASYMELRKHLFVKHDIYKDEIKGVKIQTVRIFMDANGQNIQKIKFIVYEKDYETTDWDKVTMVFNTPVTGDPNSIELTHLRNNQKLVESKALSKIKNKLSAPLRNNIKRQFILPYLRYTNESLSFIVEAYYKSLKDVDENMSLFLKKSVR